MDAPKLAQSCVSTHGFAVVVVVGIVVESINVITINQYAVLLRFKGFNATYMGGDEK